MNSADLIKQQEKICEERYVKRPNLLTTVLAVIGVLGSAGVIVSVALTQENRITSVEKDIQSVAKKVERLERIDWKIDTLLLRTAPK